jgi:sporulation-control protein spo0M
MTNRKHTVWELRKETTVSTKWNISCNTALTGNDRDLITGDDDLIDDESNPMQSPILSAQEETKIRKVRSMQANGGFTFNFTKRFSFRNSTGMRYQTSRQDIFYGEKIL